MERDLTVGKPITAILKYTLPLFGSIIFQQLYNIADSLVAGRYIGTDALAAVGNGYEITLLFIAVAFGCNIGTSVITARYFGKKDIRGVKTTVSTALIVSTVIAVILTALGLGLTKPLLHLIKTDPVIFTDSYEYLMIYLGGYISFVVQYRDGHIFGARRLPYPVFVSCGVVGRKRYRRYRFRKNPSYGR